MILLLRAHAYPHSHVHTYTNPLSIPSQMTFSHFIPHSSIWNPGFHVPTRGSHSKRLSKILNCLRPSRMRMNLNSNFVCSGAFPPIAQHSLTLRNLNLKITTCGKKLQDIQFPYHNESVRAMMSELLSILEKHLGDELVKDTTPEGKRLCKSSVGEGEGYINVMAGKDRNKFDRVLVSWLHCDVGSLVLNSASLAIQVGPGLDAPHMLIEFMFIGDSNLVVTIDLVPRKDLVLNFDYLKRYYEDTSFISLRKKLDNEPRLKRYTPSNLHVASIHSPAAMKYDINVFYRGQSLTAGGTLSEDLVKDVLRDTAVKALEIWVSTVKSNGVNTVPSDKQAELAFRDSVIYRDVIEMDMLSHLPPVMGKDATTNFLRVYRMQT